MDNMTPPEKVKNAVAELMNEIRSEQKDEFEPLHFAAMRMMRRHPFAKNWTDHTQEAMLPNMKILAGVMILGKRLKSHWRGQKMVGVLLPPTIGGAVVNIAALFAGKIPINLNYTSSSDILEYIVEKCEIEMILTSRVFMEKLKLKLPDSAKIVYIEDVREGVTKQEQFKALCEGMLLPFAEVSRRLGSKRKPEMDDLCTLIFSSGSTGMPKGIRLTHWNITANIEAIMQVFPVKPGDKFLGILPFFHSFGFTGTLWLPALKNIGVVYFPTPLDPRAAGGLSFKFGITHLIATPTFLASYIRRVEPEQFGSLKFVITGAEKLRESVASNFEEKFDVRPMEAYGATECSPGIALNTINFRTKGIFQRGNRPGSVGHPFPGVLIQIRDLDSGELLPTGESGMVYVKGPNVMSGYYKDEEKTKAALSNGWYKTGDVGKLTEEGLLVLTDRLARFSKIGGEMVPHVTVEEALQKASGLKEPMMAVTAVEDEKKGERLAVIYSCEESTLKKALKGLKEQGMPALYIPKENDCVSVDNIPVLGTGKLDLQEMKRIAKEKLEK